MNDSRRNRMNGFQTIPPEGEKILQNSGKLVGIPEETLKERLREAYV